jgi:hypothetical protein
MLGATIPVFTYVDERLPSNEGPLQVVHSEDRIYTVI